MEFQQFYLSCLAHASYLLGSEGEAAVVDPQRDVEIYLDEAKRLGLQIRYVIETHLHADFVSGHLELARRTGAEVLIGAQADAKFPHRPVSDGMEIRMGRVVLRFLTTPGHTVESISVVITDLDRGERPWAVLTGDTLFIGDVGRPDLSPDHTPQQLAGLLYDSLHNKLLTLPDDTLVYPAHGRWITVRAPDERGSFVDHRPAESGELRVASAGPGFLYSTGDGRPSGTATLLCA